MNQLGITFIMMVVGSVTVGWLAHSWKGRTGAAWAFITFFVMVPIWLLLSFSTGMSNPELYATKEGWYALGIVVSGGVAILMALIVATLPSRKQPESSDPVKKKCPFCAEEIKIEAKVCRFCGRDVAEERMRIEGESDDKTD